MFKVISGECGSYKQEDTLSSVETVEMKTWNLSNMVEYRYLSV